MQGDTRTRFGGCSLMNLCMVKPSKRSVLSEQALEEYEMTKRLEEEEVEYAISSCLDGVDSNGQVWRTQTQSNQKRLIS